MKKVFKTLANGLILCIIGLAFISTSHEVYDKYLYELKASSVVKITKTYAAQRGGTGFLVKAPSGKKYIMTNAHICSMGDKLVVTDYKGRKRISKVHEVYPKHDLCLMNAVSDVPALYIASNIEKRERVHLIGHPGLRGLSFESGYFVGPTTIQLVGVCNSKNYRKIENLLKIEPEMPLIKLERLIQQFCTTSMTSNHINVISYGGNSGSPVLNKFGNVVGVLYAGRRDQNTASHMVPLTEIKKFLKNK